jgi:hypothetical protein
MRSKFVIGLLCLACGVAISESPLPINVSSAGVEINGTTYTTHAALVEAFRKLKPSAVRFIPKKDAPYHAVEDALRALQESGIKTDTGFIGIVGKDH